MEKAEQIRESVRDSEEQVFETASGIPVEELYGPAHVDGLQWNEALGAPGRIRS